MREGGGARDGGHGNRCKEARQCNGVECDFEQAQSALVENCCSSARETKG
jgi:hypothetical protein